MLFVENLFLRSLIIWYHSETGYFSGYSWVRSTIVSKSAVFKSLINLSKSECILLVPVSPSVQTKSKWIFDFSASTIFWIMFLIEQSVLPVEFWDTWHIFDLIVPLRGCVLKKKITIFWIYSINGTCIIGYCCINITFIR